MDYSQNLSLNNVPASIFQNPAGKHNNGGVYPSTMLPNPTIMQLMQRQIQNQYAAAAYLDPKQMMQAQAFAALLMRNQQHQPQFSHPEFQKFADPIGSPAAKRIKKEDRCPGCHMTLESSDDWSSHFCPIRDEVKHKIDCITSKLETYNTKASVSKSSTPLPLRTVDIRFKDRQESIQSIRMKINERDDRNHVKKKEMSPSVSLKDVSPARSSSSLSIQRSISHHCKHCLEPSQDWKVSASCNDLLCSKCWKNAKFLENNQDTEPSTINICPFCEHQFVSEQLIACHF